MDKPNDIERHSSAANRLSLALRRLPYKLAGDDAPVYYALLAVISGLVTGLVILAFRSMFEIPLEFLIAGDASGRGLPDWLRHEGFEDLPRWLHFALPVSGGLLIGLALHRMAPEDCRTGLPHVVYGVHNLRARLPLRNLLVQFFGGITAMISGQSVGREGPAVHLGAATNSVIGQHLGFPDNSLRVLAGCGTAAAIAASFNTPIAGVIFAMEVVLMEYTLTGFIPVMLASVSATIVNRIAYGGAPLLAIAEAQQINLVELIWVVPLAIMVACASGLFVQMLKFWLKFTRYAMWIRLGLAGLITGCLALAVPQVMGLGYDVMSHTLQGSPLPLFIIGVLFAKMVASSAAVSLGIPGGMIGPSLVMGACVGSLVGQLATFFSPTLVGSPMLYAMLGMAAMMAACLNAPLAALMTLLELTYNPHVMFPGLLVIALTTILHSSVLRQASAVNTVFNHLGLELTNDPVSMLLQRRGVASLMQTSLVIVKPELGEKDINQALQQARDWLVFESEGENWIVSQEELREARDSGQPSGVTLKQLHNASAVPVIRLQSSLHEAWQILVKHNARYGLVVGHSGSSAGQQLGIISRQAIENRIWHN